MKLIDADELLARTSSAGAITDYGKYIIEHAPTIDAVTVVHGRWKFGRTFNHIDFYVCSECGAPTQGKPPFCCNCGARMDAEEAEQ